MLLYRPVGLEELRLIYESGMRSFPPRLPDQPIFYPVTNVDYARQIARDWNTKAGTLAGFVTRFSVNDAHANRFERRVVGAKEHEELWVPADELPLFNANIEGSIDVVDAFFGEAYVGAGAGGRSARERFAAIAVSEDPRAAVSDDRAAVFLDFFFWERTELDGIPREARDAVLASLREAWEVASLPGLRIGTIPVVTI